MASKQNSICGVEIGREVLTLVNYFPSERSIGGIAISNPLEQGNEQWWHSVGVEFKQMATRMKLGGQLSSCSLPVEFSVVKKLESEACQGLPVEALQWELSQQIIGSIDDYVFDFEPIPAAAADPSGWYLAAGYRGTVVKRVSAMLKAQHLRVQSLSLDIFALINVFEHNYPEYNSEPVHLVLGGEECTKVVLCHNGEFIDYELVVHGAEELDSTSYTNHINTAIKTLTTVHAARVGSDQLRMFVAGPMFFQDEFCARCLASLPGAEILFPFKTIGCRALSEGDLLNYAPQLAVAVGLALQVETGA